MSSMRNAVQRRNHKERAQPREREKWGLLEKHKDYSLRARDYNAKKARLKTLRQKAAERNPDEFYYGMLSSSTKKGRKLADRGNPLLSHEAVQLLKTQDSGYLQTMIQKTRKAIERLEEEFTLKGEEVGTLDGEGGEGRKVVFVANEAEQRDWLDRSNAEASRDGEAQDEANDEKEVGAMRRPKSRKALQKEQAAQKEDKLWRKRIARDKEVKATRLTALKAREKDLRDAENELELQRAKMSNTIGGVNKAGVKWKVRERRK